MTDAVAPVPAGFRTVTPHLTIRGVVKAIEFYKKAFGATEPEVFRDNDDAPVMHAEIRIGDSIVMLNDEFPSVPCSPQSIGGTPVTIHLFVEDADAMYASAVAAGAEATMPIMDAFWGDRYGMVTDPFGHRWAIATRKENLTCEQIRERAQEYFAAQAQ